MRTDFRPSEGWLFADPGRGADLILEQVEMQPTGMHELVLREAGTPTTVTIRTVDPEAWVAHVVHQRGATDPFAGIRIGDIVLRGKGKLRWRVTGLSHRSRPMVHLLSQPEAVTQSPQTYTASTADAIAALILVERGEV